MIQHIEDIEKLEIHFSKARFTKRLVTWSQANKRSLPWRDRWLQSNDPYVVWVSEIMLQQTVIKAVIPAYERFLDRFQKVEDLAAASEDEVRLASRGLGYYRRFRMMHQAAQYLAANPDEIWPEDFNGWKALPGIGDYTAAAISSICFDDPSPVVDGNVERVFCRLFDIRLEPNLPKLKKKFFKMGLDLISQRFPGDYNQGVMELGQTTCTKQSPSCHACPMQKYCKSYEHDSQTLAPKAKAKIEYSQVGLSIFVPKRGKLIGLKKRPNDSKFLKETWGFPTAISKGNTLAWDGSVSLNLKAHLKSESIGTVKHSITSHKIKAEVFPMTLKLSEDLRWFESQQVEENLLSNLDRKAWKAFLKSQEV